MSTELVQHVAHKLALRDWEHSRHQEPEDFYEDLADVAIRAYEAYMVGSRSSDGTGETF